LNKKLLKDEISIITSKKMIINMGYKKESWMKVGIMAGSMKGGAFHESGVIWRLISEWRRRPLGVGWRQWNLYGELSW
jgi:hypothetical protein